jgi:MtfA peptidase
VPTYLLLVMGLVLAAAVALWPLWRSRRRALLRQQAFPGAWRRILRRRVPLVARMPPDLQLRLKGLMQVFLAEKAIVGCNGLQVTEEMRVVVAAQACLPLLRRTRGYYPKLRQVLLYPGPFVVDRPVMAGAGVLQEQRRVLSGESWSQGQVILSWPDVLAGAMGPDDGVNVVLHEFAHQLDQVKGFANGAPPLPDAQSYASWSEVMQREFDALQARLSRGEQGPALQREHPLLYQELSAYFGVASADWH